MEAVRFLDDGDNDVLVGWVVVVGVVKALLIMMELLHLLKSLLLTVILGSRLWPCAIIRLLVAAESKLQFNPNTHTHKTHMHY